MPIARPQSREAAKQEAIPFRSFCVTFRGRDGKMPVLSEYHPDLISVVA